MLFLPVETFLEQLVGKRARKGFTLCTFDVRNLYPSIDRLHFLDIDSHRMHRFWAHKPEYSGFLIKLTAFCTELSVCAI